MTHQCELCSRITSDNATIVLRCNHRLCLHCFERMLLVGYLGPTTNDGMIVNRGCPICRRSFFAKLEDYTATGAVALESLCGHRFDQMVLRCGHEICEDCVAAHIRRMFEMERAVDMRYLECGMCGLSSFKPVANVIATDAAAQRIPLAVIRRYVEDHQALLRRRAQQNRRGR